LVLSSRVPKEIPCPIERQPSRCPRGCSPLWGRIGQTSAGNASRRGVLTPLRGWRLRTAEPDQAERESRLGPVIRLLLRGLAALSNESVRSRGISHRSLRCDARDRLRGTRHERPHHRTQRKCGRGQRRQLIGGVRLPRCHLRPSMSLPDLPQRGRSLRELLRQPANGPEQLRVLRADMRRWTGLHGRKLRPRCRRSSPDRRRSDFRGGSRCRREQRWSDAGGSWRGARRKRGWRYDVTVGRFRRTSRSIA
jgi:hypothetical protein